MQCLLFHGEIRETQVLIAWPDGMAFLLFSYIACFLICSGYINMGCLSLVRYSCLYLKMCHESHEKTGLIIFGKIHFLLISENEFTNEIKRDWITSFMDFMTPWWRESGQSLPCGYTGSVIVGHSIGISWVTPSPMAWSLPLSYFLSCCISYFCSYFLFINKGLWG